MAGAGSGRRDGVGALGRVGGEERRVVGGWALGAAGEIEDKRGAEVAGDQRPVPTGKSVNVGHHAGWPMHHMKEVAQKFLGPAAHLVDGAVVFQNFFDTAAITKPIESGSPQVLPILSNGPATDGRLTDERVIVLLGSCASPAAKADWSKACTLQGEVEFTFTSPREVLEGGQGFGGVVGLHEDIAEGVGGPIGLQEARFTGVVARKQRGAHNVELEFVKEGEQVRCPAVGRDGLAVEFGNEGAEGFDGDFEPGAETVVKVTEADERAEALAVGGELPVLDKIKLGFGGAVAVGGDVVANVLETALEEVTFRELEGDLVFDKNLADAVEVVQKGGKVAGEQKDVVNDHAATFVGGLGVQRIEEGIPLLLHDLHHSGVRGGGVLRSERHHFEGVLLAIRAEKGELVTVHQAYTDLMVALAGIKTDEPKMAKPVTKVVDSVVAARDRILEREGDCIQLAVGDAHAPDEVIDVGDVLLMRLGSKDN